MPVLDVYNMQKEKVSEITLNDDVFSVPVREDVLHEVVTMQLAKRRAGTASTKDRSEVSGGGSKPWRQKGTGRARSGSNTSPVWRRGGAVFGPKPRDYSYKVTRKVRKLALRMALSAKLRDSQMLIVDDFTLDEIKTKKIVQTMNNLGVENVLIVMNERQENLEKSARNIPYVDVLPYTDINVHDILIHNNLILHRDCIPKIEEFLLS
ncbi:MAG: 50S ribosomal protein L4 [Thermodesulfobacteriota bacterium]|nr:50S ribosomal protein L4 [Desulfovibrionales bacterium]MDQ7838870.1 50S ribosomal protein L4 [Thermodesulfobacteriota bacterium]